MKLAIKLAAENVAADGGPFAAVVVRDGHVIATGVNRVTATNDPTAHAEIVAIRKACDALGTFQLGGCDIYASCEPCPMCLSAIYWARASAVYYAATKEDAAAAGFADAFIYEELALPSQARKLKMVHMATDDAAQSFRLWASKGDRVDY